MTAIHGILGLGLLLTLGAQPSAELKPTPAQKGGARTVAKPDWARGMPPESTIDYSKELRRRIAEGQIVRVRTVVRSFLPVALSSLNRELSHGVHVSGTAVEIASPPKYKGLELLIHHQRPPDARSCWRAPGCKIEFDVSERQLEATQVKLPRVPLIYNSDLKEVSLGSPSAVTPVTPSVSKDARR